MKTKISGIYKIINLINGKYYVGSSKNCLEKKYGRWSKHKYALNCNKHPNIHLQRAWNRYGEKNFKFIIVKKCNLKELLSNEQKYLEIARQEKKGVYNKTFVAGRVEWTKELRKKKSLNMMGEKNPNYRMGYKIKGKLNPFYGKKHSKLTKRKMKENHYNCNGKNNPQYKKEIFLFKNVDSNEIFSGTRYEFYNKYNLNAGGVSELINKNLTCYKKWILV